ncbi:MAG: hypothetical protein LBD98_03155 [Endomicrobium sp.]|jgi:hypothetical protein|nr:hypothetical protein [Endomicrobium sp.]
MPSNEKILKRLKELQAYLEGKREDNTPNKADPMLIGNYQQFLKDAQEETETNRNISGQFLQMGDELMNKSGTGFAPMSQPDGQRDIVDWGFDKAHNAIDHVKKYIHKRDLDKKSKYLSTRGWRNAPSKYLPTKSLDRAFPESLNEDFATRKMGKFQNLMSIAFNPNEVSRDAEGRLPDEDRNIVNILRGIGQENIPANLFNGSAANVNVRAWNRFIQHLIDNGHADDATPLIDFIRTRHGPRIRDPRVPDLGAPVAPVPLPGQDDFDFDLSEGSSDDPVIPDPVAPVAPAAPGFFGRRRRHNPFAGMGDWLRGLINRRAPDPAAAPLMHGGARDPFAFDLSEDSSDDPFIPDPVAPVAPAAPGFFGRRRRHNPFAGMGDRLRGLRNRRAPDPDPEPPLLGFGDVGFDLSDDSSDDPARPRRRAVPPPGVV